MTHRELCEDLARIKETPYVEVYLGSKWLQNPQRADVVNIRPSYTQFCIDIYECKVSRDDLLWDLKSEKWRGYLDHCHRFYFAITSECNFFVGDIPDECGLLIRGEKGWKTQKQAKLRDTEIPEMTLLSLLFYRKKDIFMNQYYNFDYYKKLKKVHKKLGKDIKDFIKWENQTRRWERE